MQVSEQSRNESQQNLQLNQDNSIKEARWMLGCVALLGISVLAMGMVAELLIATPNV